MTQLNRRQIFAGASVAALAVAAGGAVACTPAGQSRRGTGSDVASLPSGLKDQLMKLTESHHVAGCSVSAVTRERAVYADAWGVARAGRPMTTLSTINIGSVSKTVTAAAVLQLVADGRIHLDGDVNDVLAQSKAYGPQSVRSPYYPGTPITVRHLLTHLTPLANGPEPGPYGYAVRTGPAPDSGELGRWLHDFLTPAPRGWAYDREQNFTRSQPGQEHWYSDIGFDLAGFLVHAVTGQPFADYCREHILGPAGMVNSDFDRDRIPDEHRAYPHAWFEDGVKKGMWLDYRNLIPVAIADDFTGHVEYSPYASCLTPDGGLRSNAIDLARWVRLWLCGGVMDGTQVISSAQSAEALSDQVSPAVMAASSAPLPFISQGYAWHRLRGDAAGVWQHAGSEVGTASYVTLDTARGVGAAIVMSSEVAADNDPRPRMLQQLLDAVAAA